MEAKFEDLLGKIITEITGAEQGSDTITFKCSDGSEYQMYHDQDCCESVYIEDVCGDIETLIGLPILLAEEVVHANEHPKETFDLADYADHYWDSFTWTFYKLSTNLGSVTLRWLGESNGYYSESVDFRKTD